MKEPIEFGKIGLYPTETEEEAYISGISVDNTFWDLPAETRKKMIEGLFFALEQMKERSERYKGPQVTTRSSDQNASVVDILSKFNDRNLQ